MDYFRHTLKCSQRAEMGFKWIFILPLTVFCILCCICCINSILSFTSVSLSFFHLARLLPEAEAEGRGWASGERESVRRAVTQAEGPPADSPQHRGPNTQGPTHLPPPAQQRRGPAGTTPPTHTPSTRPLKQSLFSALDLSHPTTPDLPSKSRHCHTHAAFLHWCNTRALSVVSEISFSGQTTGTDEVWSNYFELRSACEAACSPYLFNSNAKFWSLWTTSGVTSPRCCHKCTVGIEFDV